MASPNSRRNKNADDKDLYTTSVESLNKLWENAPSVLRNCKEISDPSFGLGDITRFFQNKGKKTIGNDLHNYGDKFSQWNDVTCYSDFLDTDVDNNIFGDIMVFNPPFTMTAEFLDKATKISTHLFMYNRLVTLESIKRAKKFKSGEWKLRKVFVFSNRQTCPRGVTYEKTANAVPYAWFWLDRDYDGAPTIDWI